MDESVIKSKEYRKTIASVTDRFDSAVYPDTLNSMKFMCNGLIGERRLEQIQDFAQLCEVLERLVKLHEDDVSFLISLIEHCWESAKDILKVVQVYQDNYVLSRKIDISTEGRYFISQFEYMYRYANFVIPI